MKLYHVLLIVLLASVTYAACPNPTYVDSYANLPSAPVFPTDYLAAGQNPSVTTENPLTQDHWSEVANLRKYRPAKITPSANPQQSECPHMQQNLKNWHDSSTWGGQVPTSGAVTIPANTKVLISSCSVDPATVFGVITIPSTSELIFGDAAITFNAIGFRVQGKLYAGSETCRLRNKITITLHGRRGAQSLPADPWIKGMDVTGSIDLHGAQYFPTWTRLAMTAKAGDTWIFVQDIVNWQPGQTILITTTELKDSRDWHRNEERIIVSVKRTNLGSNVAAIQLDSALAYKHFGGKEYQAEVSLLSRNILVQGDNTNSEPTDTANSVCDDVGQSTSTYPCENSYLTGFGAHIFVNSAGSEGRFSGVEMYRVGQTNVLGRYPIHFHLIGNITSSNYKQAYVQDSAVHRSYFRCYAIHGTHGVKLTQNTAYDAIGHCYFLEDGIEEDNILSYNQAAHVHMLGPYWNPSINANGDSWWAQYLSWYNADNNKLILPSDMAAGCFYVTNTYNDFIGNAASGGFAGFSIPSLKLPVKLFNTVKNISPANRPFRTPFVGNSAHSSGYWWNTAGAIYVGGELNEDGPEGALRYTTGRSLTRDTCRDKTAGTPTPNAQQGCWNAGDPLWLTFADNKVFLANRGMQHWGNRAEIIRLELHDVSLSMNVFGQVWIDQMLMECRSQNHRPVYFQGCPAAAGRSPPSTPAYYDCSLRDMSFWTGFGGFQWYDVSQQHILTNSVFRNCREDWSGCGNNGKCNDVAVFTSLTHSDQFVPELMQVTSNISYQSVTDLWRFTTKTTDGSGVTVSGRLQNWVDADGSASQLGAPAMIGSAWANEWWKYNDDCQLHLEAWRCVKRQADSQASFIFSQYNPSQESQIGGNICVNGHDGTQGKFCPVVATASHWGVKDETKGLDIGVNARVSGPIIAQRGGWFVRFKDGTPTKMVLRNTQVESDDTLMLAFPYPAGTTFQIYYQAADWCGDHWATCRHNYRSVNSIAEVKNAFGDAYFWDSNARILYMRVVTSPATFPKPDTTNWSKYPVPSKFARGGQSIVSTSDSFIYILASNCQASGLFCAKQTSVAVPDAYPLVIPSPTPAPTPAPVTSTPTPAPTPVPTTRPPTTAAPTTRAPTSAGTTTPAPTPAGVTSAPTTRTPTQTPTPAPTTRAPTTTTRAPTGTTTRPPTTAAPTTRAPTSAGTTTRAPTSAGTTSAPTSAPTTRAPTSPTTNNTTVAPGVTNSTGVSTTTSFPGAGNDTNIVPPQQISSAATLSAHVVAVLLLLLAVLA